MPTPAPHHDTIAAGFHAPYEVKDCEYGRGLFAAVDIPKGTLIWKYRGGKPGTPGINVAQYHNEAEGLARLVELGTEEARLFWLDHVYGFNGSVNEILDEGKLWNHSEAPCTGLPPKGDQYDWESSYSIRDIKAGEQLLDDYGIYEYPDWLESACEKAGCARSYVVKKEISDDKHRAALE